ncbi:hypothetical protein [Streptomyces sp. NPDC002889]|uniref:hypothetical protein n=1 Tax=Streptomyces sp. NPDC002889 TaxID=3364669 RepID=UPI0036C527D1
MRADLPGKRRAVLPRFSRRMGRILRAEWQAIVVEPVRELSRRRVKGVSLAMLATFAVIFLHEIHRTPSGAVAIRLLGEVHADLPITLALLRTPVSLFVPALELPVWAGLPKLFLAFALAELSLGRTRTLLIAYGTTLAGTLSARAMIALGPGGIGLPPEAGQAIDTGPSAAVVGLFTYIAVIRRAPVLFTLTGGSMVVASLSNPNLAGREHLVAVLTAIVLAALHKCFRTGRKARQLRSVAGNRGTGDGG